MNTETVLRQLERLTVQLTGIIALGSLQLGQAYMSEGYGLHPLIAFPAATLMVLIPYFLPRTTR